jgi:hypothetical protein
MKIRIKGNSVRYRLSKSEVALFGETGLVSEQTELMLGTLTYELQRASCENLTVEFSNQTIRFLVPETIASAWVQTDEIGYQHKMLLPNGKEVFLLLEKDFVCIDNTFEDQSDNYPNPNAVC